MARTHSPLSLSILKYLERSGPTSLADLYNAYKQRQSNKAVYNALYRMSRERLIEHIGSSYALTPEAGSLIHKFFPKKDGMWKIVVFDIPEKKREVRTFLRGRLEQLSFQRWQNSIWISPYALDKDIEEEFKKLAERYFIRLIKTSKINYTRDLEKMFPE